MNPFCTLWKHQKTVLFSGLEKGCIGNEWVNVDLILLADFMSDFIRVIFHKQALHLNPHYLPWHVEKGYLGNEWVNVTLILLIAFMSDLIRVIFRKQALHLNPHLPTIKFFYKWNDYPSEWASYPYAIHIRYLHNSTFLYFHLFQQILFLMKSPHFEVSVFCFM